MTPEEARVLLAAAGASERLHRHGELVLEAAEALLAELSRHGVRVDANRIRAGALLHDVARRSSRAS